MVCMETGLKFLVSSADVTLKPLQKKKTKNTDMSSDNEVLRKTTSQGALWKKTSDKRQLLGKNAAG